MKCGIYLNKIDQLLITQPKIASTLDGVTPSICPNKLYNESTTKRRHEQTRDHTHRDTLKWKDRHPSPWKHQIRANKKHFGWSLIRKPREQEAKKGVSLRASKCSICCVGARMDALFMAPKCKAVTWFEISEKKKKKRSQSWLVWQDDGWGVLSWDLTTKARHADWVLTLVTFGLQYFKAKSNLLLSYPVTDLHTTR